MQIVDLILSSIVNICSYRTGVQGYQTWHVFPDFLPTFSITNISKKFVYQRCAFKNFQNGPPKNFLQKFVCQFFLVHVTFITNSHSQFCLVVDFLQICQWYTSSGQFNSNWMRFSYVLSTIGRFFPA